MLTDAEKELIERAFYQGPSALIDAGMSPDAIRAFMERPEVEQAYELLKREFEIHDPLKSRAKFIARRNLHRMLDSANAVMALALAGPEYARDKDGNIQKDHAGRPIERRAEVSPTQMRAAEFVVNGVGLHDFRIQADPGADNNVSLLFSSAEEAITIEHDPTQESEEERALSRERVRTAIQRLAPRLVEARVKVKEEMGIDPGTETTAARRKRAKKKASKKRATKKKTTKKKAAKKRSSRRGKASGS